MPQVIVRKHLVAAAAALIAVTSPPSLTGQVVSADPTSPPDACSALIRGYATWHPSEEATAAWHLTAERPGGGVLRLFGAQHSRDPAHAQFAAIDEAWAATRPTVAFYEGPNRPIAESGAATITTTGESGYLRWLAGRDGVRLARLEPDPQDELDAVLEQFSGEQAALFYVLREAARLRGTGADSAGIDNAIAQLLGRAAQLFRNVEGAFSTIDGLEAAYRRHFSAPTDWRQVPSHWFSPLDGGDVADGRFTNAINRVSSEYRNLHMTRMIAAEFRAGERVFVVVGRNHVPMIAPALECEASPPA